MIALIQFLFNSYKSPFLTANWNYNNADGGMVLSYFQLSKQLSNSEFKTISEQCERIMESFGLDSK